MAPPPAPPAPSTRFILAFGVLLFAAAMAFLLVYDGAEVQKLPPRARDRNHPLPPAEATPTPPPPPPSPGAG
jgi:uncharacterized membrane protein YagU involved in acid resistance